MTASLLHTRIVDALSRARRRTTLLTDSVDDAELIAQHSPLMSPLVWDLAHIGSQEELWLVRDVGGREPVRPDIDDLYDAFQHARADRPALPLLTPDQSRRYVAQVREKAWDVLDRTVIDGASTQDPLRANGFAFGMLAQHEQQHCETMLATHQLRTGPAVLVAEPAPRASYTGPAEIVIPAGPFTMGTSTEAWALDNERPAHRVDVDAYAIDAVPVTNGRYLQFLSDGGYDRPELWTERGWRHRCEAGLQAPRFWERDADGRWWRNRFGVLAPVRPEQPVVHVSWFEADAFARWAGRRLPTEAE